MGPSWALAFVLAFLITLVTTPVLRRLALAIDLVDHPGARKVHAAPIPYLGGVGLIVSVLVGLLFTADLAPSVGVIALGAALLGTVGLLDDDHTVPPRYRLLAQLAAAGAAAAVGLRVHATGVVALDVVLTLVWIVGVTNAMNLLDNMDGLAAGVSAVAAGAVFVLATLDGQHVAAHLAGAMAGACLAFLAYNRRPASIFMGDAGSLFLGFVLAVLTVDVNVAVEPPASFVVPVLLLAIPVLDTTTVTLGRLRHGRAVSSGGKDHLSHRLVARGLSPGMAVVVLVAAEALLGVLAVLAGRRQVPLAFAVLGALAVVGTLAAWTAASPVYAEAVTGLPRRLRVAGVVLLALVAVATVPAVVAIARARTPAQAGADVASRALAAVGRGDGQAATADFQRARQLFDLAHRRLSGPLTSLGVAVPVLSPNLRASRTLVSMGRELAGTGAGLAQVAESGRLRIRGRAVPVQELRGVAPDLLAAARVLTRSRSRLADIDEVYLLPPIRRAVEDLSGRLTRQEQTVGRAAQAARSLPGMLGADGATRRYFLAVQNNAELRATGGFVGNWGELVAEGGRLRLERFGRIEDLIAQAERNGASVQLPDDYLRRYQGFFAERDWRQTNISPDFPTAARIMSELYPQSGGQAVDGVIATDPVGLASLLELTGPVQVREWPEPISAANVVDVTLRAQYERFGDRQERVAFLGVVARRVFEAFTTGDLGRPSELSRALGAAAGRGHLLAYFRHPAEQELMAHLGADGAVPPVRGDSLLVVNQNLSANKVDFYLRRRVRYTVRLDPSQTPAALAGRVEVALENGAPARYLPSGALGPHDDRFVVGENRTYLSVYSPFDLQAAHLDQNPVGIDSHAELGRRAHSTELSMAAGQSRTVGMDLAGAVRLAPGGWYRLDILRQPQLTTESIDVELSVPPGWRITDAPGLRRQGARQASGRLTLERPRVVMVRVEPARGRD